ncbi:MAG: glycosyltransferase [Pirellulales bacterium]|nr:glycosyltransferase [Pirellulales bacterium]
MTTALVTQGVGAVNSQPWWESYFATTWDGNCGRVQTTRFMECVVRNLPTLLREDLQAGRLSILDWGCAFGDGVRVLAEAFPRCQVAGLDFAQRAINESRRVYPQHEFIHAIDGRITRPFDVVVTSNCLEHFDEPLEVAAGHLAWCQTWYVVLVPYNEANLLDQHRSRFTESSFPERLHGFVRICVRAVDVDQRVWTGQQLIAVYVSIAALQQNTTLRRRFLEWIYQRKLPATATCSARTGANNSTRDGASTPEATSTLPSRSNEAARDGFVSGPLQNMVSGIGNLEAWLLESFFERIELTSCITHIQAEHLQQTRRLESQLQALQAQLAAIEHSRTWRLACHFRTARMLCVPPQSLRAQSARAMVRGLRAARRGAMVAGRGASALLRKSPTFPQTVVSDFRWLASGAKTQAKRVARRTLPPATRQWIRRALHRSSQPTPEATLRWQTFVANHVHTAAAHKLVVIVSGTTLTTAEGQRPTRLAREFARREIPVLFVYFRWNERDPLPATKSPWVLELPLDWFVWNHPAILCDRSLGSLERALLMEFPHPSLLEIVNAANAYGWRTIYDIIDDWDEFHAVGQAEWHDPDIERYLANNADVVTVTCAALRAKAAGRDHAEVVLLPNAYEDWSVPIDLAEKPGSADPVRVGYFGHLTPSWFDWGLVAQAARRRPDWVFEIIGYGDESAAPSLPNVRLLGKVEHAQLPSHARSWNVAMIPFRSSKLAAAVDPIKIYEYIALGLPTVVCGMPHLSDYPGVVCCEGADAFVAAVERVGRQRLSDAEVTAFLAGNRWVNRVDRLLELVERPEHRAVMGRAISGLFQPTASLQDTPLPRGESSSASVATQRAA